eukprot:COSAG04_NODE_6_length_47123_cov_87.347482_33_plen_70_part_00
MPISRLIASCEELGVDPEALERLFTAAEEEVTSGKARPTHPTPTHPAAARRRPPHAGALWTPAAHALVD